MTQPRESPTSPIACDSNTRALVFLRIAVGVFFLIFGEYKVFGTQFTLHGGFQFWINKFFTEGGAYPFMVPIFERVRPPERHHHRVPGRLWRVFHRPRPDARHPGPPSQPGRSDLHAHSLVFLRLSWLGRALLAVLRRQPRTLRFRALLHRVHDRPLRYSLVHQSLASDASTVGKPTGVSRLSSGLPFPNLIKSWRH